MLKKEFGAAGDEIVIEEFLEGEELSFLSFSDGFTLRSLPPAQVRVFEDLLRLSCWLSSLETSLSLSTKAPRLPRAEVLTLETSTGPQVSLRWRQRTEYVSSFYGFEF